ncbi:MAG: hypothetical protein IKI90_06165 [Treponema sp.]|nr:hypothetical protein [Treponema sp.]
MNAKDRTERVLQWRAYLATMENEKFFNIIRMYLGEVKTPFNKQKLIEDLSSFLRKEENKKSICSLLGKNDLKFLSFISMIPNADYETIASFFANENFGHSIYDHIENLKERLLIYTLDDESSSKKLRINPLLEESLSPFLGIECLLDDPGKIEQVEPHAFFLTPMLMTSFISFVSRHPELCKANGELKKKICEELVELYGASLDEKRIGQCMQKLVDGMCNLGLFETSSKGVLPNWDNLEKYAALDYYSAMIFLAASSAVHLTRQYLQKYAFVLVSLFSSIPKDGYTLSNLTRLAYLIYEKNWDRELEGSSRFEKILAQHENSALGEEEESSKKILGSIVENSIYLGLLKLCGTSEKGEELYVPVQESEVNCLDPSSKKVLSVDTSLSITIMPGLSLVELLPFSRMMDICHFDVAAVYEINRHSATRWFDTGANPTDIISLLNEFSAFPMPQNLQVIVEEWYASYSSAKLFYGYVLKLSEHNCEIAEKSPYIASHLIEKLAPGVYLLDLHDDEEVQNLMIKSGMEFTGKIRKVAERQPYVSYPAIPSSGDGAKLAGLKKIDSVFESDKAEHLLLEMEKALSKMEMSKEQREGLAERIERRIVVNTEQLRPGSVRFEKLEALSMDYAGKIHVVENAMQTKSLVEIETEETKEAIVGLPIDLEKTSGKASATIRCSNGKIKIVSISSAKSIKKIREKLDY